MSLFSKLYSIYISFVTKNGIRNIVILPNTKVFVDKLGKLSVLPNVYLIVGQNWSNLPFFLTGVKVDNNAKLRVMGNFKIYSGCTIAVYLNAELILGSGYINNHSEIHCFESIIIGNNVIISSHVNIRDSDNHEIFGQRGSVSAPIIIKDNVWIGMRAIILKGVTIGEGSVIAAGTIVTKDVPPNSLVAGNPGKVIRENIVWK